MSAAELIAGGLPEPLGATIVADGVNFAVRSATASDIFVSLFDEADNEIAMVPLERSADGVFFGLVAGIGAGARYGLRADGRYAPAEGHRFDPAKLLVDPYAQRLDRGFRTDPRLTLPRQGAPDTAALVPKAFVVAPAHDSPRAPRRRRPRLIYEMNVRGQTMLHPDVPAALRGTVAALGEPAVLDHLLRIGVDTVELMPVAAWIDDRHLMGLGLTNFWGYNPVAMMAPDPRLMPGGVADLREVTGRYAEAGIAVILDVVFNHTGEGDAEGPVLSMRGLDNLTYYRHRETDDGLKLVNDTGCGNTLACDRAAVVELVLASLRHWMGQAGVAGFRFDLATALGRGEDGFDAGAPLLKAMRRDRVLSKALLVAEPWDVGPGGYQMGRFGPPFLEWNDAYRDEVRRYWRGDAGAVGEFATRLAGSADVFGPGGDLGRSVNFICAHDGFTLADLVAYEGKNNAANLEHNRDGSDHNYSWNNGVEGDTSDATVLADRQHDIRALLATLLVSRGTPMLTSGDEMGMSQGGNNNAYAQDNPISWIEWQKADPGLIDYVGELTTLRAGHPVLGARQVLTGVAGPGGVRDCVWLRADGTEMASADWRGGDGVLGMMLSDGEDTVLVWFNRARQAAGVVCPPAPGPWAVAVASASPAAAPAGSGAMRLAARSVTVLTQA